MIWKKTRSKTHNIQANKQLVQVINTGLIDLNKEIKKMSKDETENEKPNEVIDAVAEILKFSKKQGGSGLKILTPEQMFSRLPISLAQLKAGNNSEKFENEIRLL